MKGDFSRDTFHPRRHYSSVRLQQGRVVTDADWNEQADITRFRAERQAGDIIGHCGAPEDAAGFGLVSATYALAVSAAAGSVWIAAEDGVILRSTDAGATWTVLDSLPPWDIRAIRFVDAATGWAAGDNGRLARTTDGGASWTPQTSTVGVTLRGVAAVDGSRAWAVGDAGTLIRTSDGGASWTKTEVGTGRLYAVHFASASAGWIVGQDGQIFSTADGGATWTSRSRPDITAPLRAVTFSGASTGWAVGDNATILKTTDGGVAWTAQSAPVATTLRAVAFADGNEGWAAGNAGTLLSTTNGGSTWQLEPSGTNATLRAAARDGAGGAWIVGDASSILRAGDSSPAVASHSVVGGSLSLSPGRLYVEGVLCEIDERSSFYRQPDRTVTTRLAEGAHLVFVDVWQRHISHLKDPRIREVALGGPDTATRARTVWQVRTLALPPTSPVDWHCLSSVPGWDALIAPPTARLRARSEPQADVSGVCEIPAAAGFRRVENQLYRVEVQEGGATPSFKWSRENGSVAYAIAGIVEDVAENRLIVTLVSRGQDENLDISADDWVEIVDDEATLEQGVGLLRRFISEGNDRLEIVLEGALGGASTGTNADRHPIIRRWEHRPAGSASAVPLQEGQWTHLEDGVQVWFEAGGSYRPGDYWQIPARTITGDVEWPRGDRGEPLPLPPAGVEHRYCRLGLIEVGADGSIVVTSDCRERFPPLTAFTQLLYGSGDGQDSIPGQELPQPLRVRVVRGTHPVEHAVVRFEVLTGLGTLVGAGTGVPLDIETLSDGTAECRWVLDANVNAASRYQRVAATLLDAAGDPVPGHRVVFCATATLILQHVAGDGQQAAANDPLAHALEVRVSNGQRPVSGVDVHFSVIEGGGSLLDATPVQTDPNGVAAIRWRLGAAGLQRVEAELQDGAGARVQHVAFNADIEAPAAEGHGGCSITIGRTGQFPQLTTELLQRLLEELEGRLCFCFLAGDHVIEDLSVDAQARARVTIHGCGPSAVIKLRARAALVSFEYVEISDLTIEAQSRTGFNFGKCAQVVIRNVGMRGDDARDQPLLNFASVPSITVEGCTLEARMPGLAVVIDDAMGEKRLTNNSVRGVVSFYGRPDVARVVNIRQIRERMLNPAVQLEPAAGDVWLVNNRLELLTIGRDKMAELDAFGAGTSNRLTSLFASATVVGNSLGDARSIFISLLLTLASTSLVMRDAVDEIVGSFVADSAAVVGSVTLLPLDDSVILQIATRRGRCREAGNMVFVGHN